MKKFLFLGLALGAILCGCSKSPMERLKSCYLDKTGKVVGCEESDNTFWNNEAKKDSELFKEAVKYCREKKSDLYNPLCGMVILPDSEPVLNYGDHPLPD